VSGPDQPWPLAGGLPARTALIHDWLVARGGAERTLEAMLQVLPGAEVYTLIHDPKAFAGSGSPLEGARVHSSFLQRLPWAQRRHRGYLPLMPLAVESFDLSGYELLLSSSHAVAKGVQVGAEQLHVSYLHTPMRYAWELSSSYLQRAGLDGGPAGLAALALLHYLRIWDQVSAHRVDLFVANSRCVARRIWRAYRRPAAVLYPPVEVERFDPGRPRGEFYLTVSRLVPYKRVDLIAQAFHRLGRPLVVIGEGPELPRLQELGGPNLRFLGQQPDAVVREHLETCRAFVFAADEDFGIAPVEAQAAGAPVLAYGHGGALETVLPGRSGLLFAAQSVASLVGAVESFEAAPHFPVELLRENAERFSAQRFRNELAELLERASQLFRRGQDPEVLARETTGI
jgi:glycosyltransferase involved in cell wall biosynthesis